MKERSRYEQPTCRIRFLAIILILATFAQCYGQEESMYRLPDQRVCPILDTPFDNLSALEVFYVPSTENTAPAWDDLAAIELNAWVRFFYFEYELGGDIEMRAAWRSTILQNFDGASSGYPLTSATLPIRWSQRYLNGWGTQIGIEPGIYSALESLNGDDLNVPVEVKLIKSLSGNFAVFAGATVYPGFDKQVVPTAGIHWSNRGILLAEIAYPELRLAWNPMRGLRFHASAAVLDWPEFNMGDDPRERLLLDESRLTAGIDIGLSDYTEITLQGGYLLERSLSFEKESADIDIENAPFFGIGIRGRML